MYSLIHPSAIPRYGESPDLAFYAAAGDITTVRSEVFLLLHKSSANQNLISTLPLRFGAWCSSSILPYNDNCNRFFTIFGDWFFYRKQSPKKFPSQQITVPNVSRPINTTISNGQVRSTYRSEGCEPHDPRNSKWVQSSVSRIRTKGFQFSRPQRCAIVFHRQRQSANSFFESEEV